MKATLLIKKKSLPSLFIESVVSELNPEFQRLRPELVERKRNEGWTWMTTSGNAIRVENTLEGVVIDLNCRRHAMTGDNGLSYFLVKIEGETQTKRRDWLVRHKESLSDAPWYEIGVMPRFEIELPPGYSVCQNASGFDLKIGKLFLKRVPRTPLAWSRLESYAWGHLEGR